MISVMATELVLGLGGTVDYEIQWDAAALDDLVREYRITSDDLSATAPIIDERSLVAVILAFVRGGGGGERFVESSEIVEKFAARFEKAITLGGTGVRAGIALDSLGIPSTQHLVSIDDNVRRLLPESNRFISSATRDTLDPHLIVQYPAGATLHVGAQTIVAPHANRLIFANDPPNREMALSDQLGDELASADGALISGFNTMQDATLLRSRLDTLVLALRRLAPTALVYYEDAGFYVPEFRAIARQRLLPFVSVYGMNEDELQEYLGYPVDLLDPPYVIAALTAVHAIIPAPALVVHTKYWAIAVGPEAHRHRSGLESAVRMAATRYRIGDGHTAADFAATAELPRHEGGEGVVEAVERGIPGSVGVAAYVIDVPEPTTIGLGDTFVGGFFAPLASSRP